MPFCKAVVQTPIGPLGLEALGDEIVRLWFAEEEAQEPGGSVLKEAARQIDGYFRGTRRHFDLPLRRPSGTTLFQHRLWDALSRIPFGETCTYGRLAAQLQTSARAVGGGCARNPLPILIPCHRVVARTGLGGFSGQWETGLALRVKRTLLQHEAHIASRAS